MFETFVIIFGYRHDCYINAQHSHRSLSDWGDVSEASERASRWNNLNAPDIASDYTIYEVRFTTNIRAHVKLWVHGFEKNLAITTSVR